MQKEIVQYLRYEDRKDPSTFGRKFGVMLATVKDGKVRIGYSVANEKKGDNFDRVLGMRIAQGRAEKSRVLVKKWLKNTLSDFSKRAMKYFQDKTLDSNIVTYCENEEAKKEKTN